MPDLDNDGNLDMIVADEGATWQYNLGNGAGNMIARGGQSYNNGCSVPTSPVAIKLSSAMYQDVAVACTNSNVVRVWSTQYSGGNQSAVFGTQNTGSTLTLNFPASTNPTHLMVADLNKDGKQDLVVVGSGNAVGTSTLTYFLNQGTTVPAGGSGTVGTNNNAQNPYWGKCGDLNADGYPDCVVSDLATNTVRIFMNDGAGVLQVPKATGGTIAVGQEPREVNLVDA